MRYLIYILSGIIMMSCQRKVLENKFKIESIDFTLVDYLIVDYLKSDNHSTSSISKFDVQRNNEYVGLSVKLNKVYSVDEENPSYSSFFGSSIELGLDGTNDMLSDFKIMIDSLNITNDFLGANNAPVRYSSSYCFNCSPYDSFTNFKVENLRYDDVYKTSDSYCVSPYVANIDSLCTGIHKARYKGGLDYKCPIFFIVEKKKFVKLIKQSSDGLSVKLKLNNTLYSLKIDL